MVFLDERLRSLAEERTVVLRVGEEVEASRQDFQVSQTNLIAVSPVFAKQLDKDKFPEGRTGVLDYPQDNIDIWQVLVFWLYERQLPPNVFADDLHLAVRCWLMGDQYQIKDFQDAVMLNMLNIFEQNPETPLPAPAMREAFARTQTQKQAKIRLLLLDQQIHLLSRGQAGDLAALTGTGALPAITLAQAEWTENGERERGSQRFYEYRLPVSRAWTEYMVNPQKWVGRHYRK